MRIQKKRLDSLDTCCYLGFNIKQLQTIFKNIHLQKCINPLPRHTPWPHSCLLLSFTIKHSVPWLLSDTQNLLLFISFFFLQGQCHPQLPVYFPPLTLKMGFVSFRKLCLTGLGTCNTPYTWFHHSTLNIILNYLSFTTDCELLKADTIYYFFLSPNCWHSI